MESGEDRTILQFFLQDRIKTVDDFTALVERVSGNRPNDVDPILNRINQSIEDFSQKLIKSTCEVSGERVISLVSIADQAEMKSCLPKEHLDYFYHLIDKIITSNGSLPFISALNLAPAATMGKLSMTEAEKVLEHLILKRLLVISDGYLFLSTLAIAELGSFITENYEVASCSLCKKIVLYGDKCRGCETPFHLHCLNDYLNAHQKAKCPICKLEATPGPAPLQ